MSRNDYREVRLLGKGGMGVTTLVENRIMGKQFAMKKGVKGEGELLQQLSHLNIPMFYDQFSENDDTYIVMEYIEGKTLTQLLATHGRFSESEVVWAGIELCKVLIYLHQKGIFYLDLKPDNIMITPEHKLYLIDFGVTASYQQNNEAAWGTQLFAPPEQFCHEEDERSDIYSLGKVLLLMLSGKNNDECKQARRTYLHSSDLVKLLISCCKQDKKKRPGTMKIVKQQLEQCQCKKVNVVVSKDIWLTSYDKDAF